MKIPQRTPADNDQDAQTAEALRLVLAVVLPRHEAWLLMKSRSDDEQCSMWPSTLYGCLAWQMQVSQPTWHRTAQVLDQRLSRWLWKFIDRPAVELAEAASDGREAWGATEFVALLWSLLRRREPALNVILVRLSAEAELSMLQMAVRVHRSERLRTESVCVQEMIASVN